LRPCQGLSRLTARARRRKVRSSNAPVVACLSILRTVCADRNNGNDRGGARGGRARRALLAKRGGDREYGGNWGIPSSSSSSDEGEGEDAEGIGGDLGVGDSSGATCSQRVRGGPRVYRICAASRDPFLLNELRFLFFGLLSCTLVLAKAAAAAAGARLLEAGCACHRLVAHWGAPSSASAASAFGILHRRSRTGRDDAAAALALSGI
jgi:hypothetical protein